MSAPAIAPEVVWHDVECGAYDADLGLWDDLAAAVDGPVLELGAGTGRVALRLAAAGHEVVAVDRAPALVDELRSRAAATGTGLEARCGDVCELALDRRFDAVIAPMQLLHLLGGPRRRLALLGAVRGHLSPGGVLAAALLAEQVAVGPADGAPPPPDVRELDGWVFSSQPIGVAEVGDGLEIRRLRQVVSPEGELSETEHALRLDRLTPDELEGEARTVGLSPRRRLRISATDDHVGSVVCVLGVDR